MRNADRENNSPSRHCVAVLKVNFETARDSLDGGHVGLFQTWYHPFPEGKPILAESVQRHGFSSVGIRDPALGTELFKAQSSLRIVNVGSKPIRLQHHSF